jgi:AcrR family transcriptional regulator
MIMEPIQASTDGSRRREQILITAIPVFGKFGFKKTSVEDVAEAADISKQGLYLHFSSKEEVFLAAMQKYLEDGLSLVQEELTRPDTSLFQRLLSAMDAWFGRHLITFTPQSFDVIETGNRLSRNHQLEDCKSAFKAKVAKALSDSPEFKKANNICTPKEISQVLFQFGLTWKDGHLSRADFMKTVKSCIRACCQIRD